MHFEVIQIYIVHCYIYATKKGCLNFIFSSNSNYSLRKMMLSIFSKLCWIKNESFYPVYSIMIDQFNFQESSFFKSGFYWNIFPQIKGAFPLAMCIFYWLYWFGGKIVSYFFNIHVWKKFVHFCRGICAFKKWYLGGFLNFNIFVKTAFTKIFI